MLNIYDKVINYEDNINIYNNILANRRFRHDETDNAV
jgi:hypothetical protein